MRGDGAREVWRYVLGKIGGVCVCEGAVVVGMHERHCMNQGGLRKDCKAGAGSTGRGNDSVNEVLCG